MYWHWFRNLQEFIRLLLYTCDLNYWLAMISSSLLFKSEYCIHPAFRCFQSNKVVEHKWIWISKMSNHVAFMLLILLTKFSHLKGQGTWIVRMWESAFFFLSFMFVSTAFCAPMAGMQLYDQALQGFENFYSPSASDCCSQCLANLKCAGYTWSNSLQCSLKQSAVSFGSNSQATSGLRTGCMCCFDIYAIHTDYFLLLISALLTAPASVKFTNFSAVGSLHLVGSTSIQGSNLQLSNFNWIQSAAFYLKPIQLLRDVDGLCQQASFSTSFSFQTLNQSQQYGADGFSFVILGADNSYFDMGRGYMGWNSQSIIKGGMVAVEYDTFQDYQYKDPSFSHIGVNLNFNPISSATYNTMQVGINLTETSWKNSWVDYDAVKGLLSVYLSKFSTKPSIPLISYKINFCSALRPLTCARCFATNSAFFGFSSSTTWYSQSVNIRAWSFSTSWPTLQTGTNSSSSGKNSIFFLHGS